MLGPDPGCFPLLSLMRLLALDPYRTIGIPGVSYLKPEYVCRERERVLAADWILFPPTWLANALVYAMKCRIFPALPGYHLGYDKIQMTRAFEAVCPAHVPRTLISSAERRGAERALDELGLPLVVKEPRNAMGCGVHLVESRNDLLAWAERAEVLYAQEYLPIDRDLRVVWVGDGIVAAYWRIGPPGGFCNNLSRGGRVCWEAIPVPALDLVTQVASRLGLDYVGFDVAVVDGFPYLLEMNLLFGNDALNGRRIRLGPVIFDYLVRQDRPPREARTPLVQVC